MHSPASIGQHIYSLCTGQVKENLTTLLNFVQDPYFTDENVEKEKGIIGQEIKMYDDNADWRLYFGSIRTCFMSIQLKLISLVRFPRLLKLSKELLYTCYNTFYHPSNMLLFVIGAVQPETIIDLVRSNQATKNLTVRKPKLSGFLMKNPRVLLYPHQPSI